jgi:hypothetical protein
MTNDQEEFWLMAATESFRRWEDDDDDRDFEHGAEWVVEWTRAFIALGEWARIHGHRGCFECRYHPSQGPHPDADYDHSLYECTDGHTYCGRCADRFGMTDV